jgi:nucleoside-diphosphate-sugar epimerase
MKRTSTWLVTGSCGFIGGPTICALGALEPDLRILSAGRSGAGGVTLDLCSSEVVLPEGVDTILHLAGEKRDESRMWAVNVEGTRRLVQAAADAGVRRFVYLSSVGVYGALKHAGLVDEHYAHRPCNTYETTKNAGEECVRDLCSRLGIEHLIIQPTNVIGHVPGRSYPLLGLMSMLQADRFVYFGREAAWVNYIHVDDVAATIAAVAYSGSAGAVYIVNTPAQLHELVGWICDEMGLALPSRHLPNWLGSAVAKIGSMLQQMTGRTMPFNGERYRELTNTTIYDGHAITQLLGSNYPIGIEQAVRSLVRIYRAEGRL